MRFACSANLAQRLRDVSALTTWIRYLLLMFALHVPSWMLVWLTNGPKTEERPIFNLDLILAAAIACVSLGWGALALMVAWSTEFIRITAKNYHFLSALDFIDAARFVDMLNIRIFLTPAVLFGAMGLFACLWAVLKVARDKPVLIRPLLLSLVAFAALEAVNGSFHMFGLVSDRWMVSVNLAGSPTWNVLNSQKRNPLASGQPVPFTDARSYAILSNWRATHSRQSALVILVESMGQPMSQQLQDWLVKCLSTDRINDRWSVEVGTERFVGATTSGELRVLCGLMGHYSKLTEASRASCLPLQWRQAGSEAIGLHGFHMRMFDRRKWWPEIGLRVWDQQPFDNSGLQMNCNEAFPGICDAQVLKEAVHAADRPDSFVYALTLDTHLPLSESRENIEPMLKRACSDSDVSMTSCELAFRLGQMLASLEESLAGMSNPPLVLIVGDHAPPFAEASNQKAFEANSVALIVLRPRQR